MEHFTLDSATKFFGELFGGVHHIPGYKVIPVGIGGFKVRCRAPMATYDNAMLTKLVMMCHDQAVRAEISPGMGFFTINIWKRQRQGEYYERHPEISEAIEKWGNNDKAAVVR